MADKRPPQKVQAPVETPDEDVRNMQGWLALSGFYAGVADGKLGPDTTDAVKRFQAANELPADGIAGPQTLDRLQQVAASSAAPSEAPPTVAFVNRASDEPAASRLTSLLAARVQFAPPAEADAVLVFISRASIEQPLEREPEMQSILARAHAGQTRLIPVVLEPVDWSQSPFVEFQAVADAQPLSELNDLGPVVEQIVQGLEGPPPSRDGRAYLPGFSADHTEGRDLLGRRGRVEFLASVLAAKQLETPLAVGLFGDWGSGKSFFMRRLQERVVELTEASAKAQDAEEPSYYCSHVRQVSFNAWLYSDSDIWPSLAAHVFRTVSGIETDAPHGPKQTEDLRTYQRNVADNVRDLVDERAQARTDAAALDERIDELTREIADRRTKLRETPEGLGATGDAVARGITDVGDIVGGVRRIAPAWRELRARDVALIVAPVAAAVALAIVSFVKPSWGTVITAVVLAALGAIALFAKVVRHVDEATQLKRELAGLMKERDELRSVRDERAKDTGVADAALDPTLVLPGFAEEQTMRWLGREQLGVVTEIRLAFERLSKLIGESRTAREAGGKPTEHLPIDRVIVYVDDLDRCQHDVVVRVLETLQLLLSLPNFVVVVGVDSRWLFRSLEVHFKELLTSEDGAAGDAAWAATPQNYLEKIFQYSIVLQPINVDGFGRLIESVLGGATIAKPPPAAPAAPAPAGDGSGAAPAPVGQERETTPADEDVDLTPDDLVITPQELRFMKSLAPVIATPRAAKRLANLYRLLRVSLGADELTATEGYEPVLLLLAIGIGYPGLAGDVFDAMESNPSMPWPVFVDGLRPVDRGDGRGVANALRAGLSPSEAEVWAGFCNALSRVAPGDVADRNLASFVDWIELVAEFSFHPWQARLAAETHG